MKTLTVNNEDIEILEAGLVYYRIEVKKMTILSLKERDEEVEKIDKLLKTIRDIKK